MFNNDTKFQENISKAYLNALAANSGVIVSDRGDQDFDGIDLTLSISDDKKRTVEVQLKSTTIMIEKNGLLKYDIKVKNHNNLCADNVLPTMLLLLILPEDRNEWVKYSVDELTLKNSLYWKDYSTEKQSSNNNKKRISIPNDQIVTESNLSDIIILITKKVLGV